VWRVHAEDMLDFELFLLNSDMALSRDEDNAVDLLEEGGVPVKGSISFRGVAKGVEGVILLAAYERILIATKGTIIDPELSKVETGSEQLYNSETH